MRNRRAAAVSLLASLLLFPGAARALAVHSFEPGDVTTGTRLTIRGDFRELAAARARPQVLGRRSDTDKTVKFVVLAVSPETIVARVASVPSTKADPAAGKTWSLVVRSPVGGGATAEADEPFTISGPVLVSVPDAEGTPGETLPLYALDPGEKPPTVLVGKRKAKVFRSRPAGESRDSDPWLVEFRVPQLRNGFQRLRLENSLGRAPETAEVLVFGGDAGGLGPYLVASLDGLAGFDTPVCTWSVRDGRLRVDACAGESCARTLSIEFQPDVSGFYHPATVAFTDATLAGVEPLRLRAVTGGAKLLPAPSFALLAGAFVATLEPDGETAGRPVRVRGYFQAPWLAR